MLKYTRILGELAATPWAMHPEKLAAMVSLFRFQSAGGKYSAEEIEQRLEAARIHPNTDRAVANKPGNVALLSLRGVISNRASQMDDVSPGTGTSTEQFTQAFRAVMGNDQIKAVVIDVDSPGGSVYGVPELAAEILAARGSKPIVASVNALCASAAYWIASACDEIVVTPSGEVGSIGVYTVHQDVSKMYTDAGINTTLISAGKYKTEGNPFAPLSDEALAAVQASVDSYYAMFTDAVAQGRGAKSADVRAGFGQGRCVGAVDAVAQGMADRVGTLSETLTRFGINTATAKSARAETPRLNVKSRALNLLRA